MRIQSRLRSSYGFSLVEVMIALGIMTIVLFGAMQLSYEIHKKQLASTQDSERFIDTSMLTAHLQKSMNYSDLRFYFFTGRPLSADRILGRFIIPQIGACRDLSGGTACAGLISYLYAHYDRSTTPSLKAICRLDASTIVIDGANPSYGLATLSGTVFNVTGASALSSIVEGDVNLAEGRVLALLDVPRATLWTVKTLPTAAGVTYNAGTDKFMRGTVEFPADCVANLQSTGPANSNKIINKLYTLQVDPLVGGQFTGGSSADVSDDDKINAMGAFPTRLFETQIRSLGPTVLTSSDRGYSATETRYDFGVSACTVDSGTISCAKTPLLHVGPIRTVQSEQSFMVRLWNSSGMLSFDFYQLIRGAGTTTASCPATSCTKLPFPNNNAIKGALALERSDLLSANEFSFLKQDTLSTIRFRVTHAAERFTDETFAIVFR